MEIKVETKDKTYSVLIERGILNNLSSYLKEDRHYYIVSDSGVPDKWKRLLTENIKKCELFVFEQGETSKNLNTYADILNWLIEKGASRKDTIIALGGGVCGDMAGFVAATYMRGIGFINIPTTLLSQVDSSVGGKTAVDLNGIKNIVGAFYQPDLVLIDPDVLDTLDERQLHNGFAEAIKMGLICDSELFEIFKNKEENARIDEVIYRSIEAKRKVVEEDEKESSLRKILNFGHTIGHGYETYFKGEYLHGECVALGMMKIVDDEEIRKQLEEILRRLNLPTYVDVDKEEVYRLIAKDKKGNHETIDVVLLKNVGEARIETWKTERIKEVL